MGALFGGAFVAELVAEEATEVGHEAVLLFLFPLRGAFATPEVIIDFKDDLVAVRSGRSIILGWI